MNEINRKFLLTISYLHLWIFRSFKMYLITWSVHNLFQVIVHYSHSIRFEYISLTIYTHTVLSFIHSRISFNFELKTNEKRRKNKCGAVSVRICQILNRNECSIVTANIYEKFLSGFFLFAASGIKCIKFYCFRQMRTQLIGNRLRLWPVSKRKNDGFIE